MSVQRLHSFLRTSVATGRTVVAVPPFTAYLDPEDPLRFLNYAIPDDDVEPTPADVERLRAVFREHDRLPRLEWIEEIAPRLAPELEPQRHAPQLPCVELEAGPALLAIVEENP